MNCYEVFFALPFPPTLNHNIGRKGRHYFRDKKYEAFIDDVGICWAKSQPRDWRKDGFFRVAISLYPSSLRRFDADNRIKPTLDALTRCGVWIDDSQVVEVSIRKLPIPTDVACAIVEITRLDRMEAFAESMKRLWHMVLATPFFAKNIRMRRSKPSVKPRSQRKK